MNTTLAAFAVSQVELVAEIERHGRWVAECLADRCEQWAPHLNVLVKTGPSTPWRVWAFSLMTPFTEAKDKHAVLRKIGEQLYRDRVIPGAAILSTEAWLSSRRDVEPRHDPDRKEVIIVQARTLLGNLCGIARMQIARSADGTIVAGEFEPPAVEGVHCSLLGHLFDGFAAAAGFNVVPQ